MKEMTSLNIIESNRNDDYKKKFLLPQDYHVFTETLYYGRKTKKAWLPVAGRC